MATPTYLTIPPPFTLNIASKPNAPISYTFIPPFPSSASPNILIFINGLGLPASSWEAALHILITQPSCPALLTYDRYGQGLTASRDPLDGTPGKERGHDFMDIAEDLNELITLVCHRHLNYPTATPEIIMIGASIGCPIIRLFSQLHPECLSGVIFLDSNIPHLNYSDFLPDPQAPGFDSKAVVDVDCTVVQYIGARKALCGIFDLDVPNKEGVDRTKGPWLLPKGEAPLMVGKGAGLELTVVGHDPITFADMSFERMGTPKSMSMKFTNKYWAEYNESMTKLANDGMCGEVIIAKGCGHFIQVDDPEFVAREIANMIKRVGW